jgi:CRISP-associated protein Cas1
MDGSSLYPQTTEAPAAHTGDDPEWAERSTHWQQQNAWRPRHPHQKRRHRNPLVLGGHGVRLRIDRGSLFVQNGFTHYPQQREEWHFFPGHPDLPSRIVVVDADGSVTFDVLAWLAVQGIPLVQANWRGEAVVVAGAGYAADRKLAAAQRIAQGSKRRTIAISRWLIGEKIGRSTETLTAMLEPTPAREQALAELAASADELRRRPPHTIDALRGIEGRAANAYVTAWRSIPLRWKGLGRKPVPEEWHRIGPRVAPNTKHNRNATHPINAILNYGYAVLETQVQMAVISAGLDPTIGFMHADGDRRSALVLDLMEPMRPAVDAVVLGFAASNAFHPVDFVLREDGVCRIAPQLARAIVDRIAKGVDAAPYTDRFVEVMIGRGTIG